MLLFDFVTAKLDAEDLHIRTHHKAAPIPSQQEESEV
jgi:hypothetical protein